MNKNEKAEKEILEKYPSLFHYTTLEGLKGIIENQTLWATHYQFMNDMSEVKFAIDVLKPYLKEALQSGKYIKILKEEVLIEEFQSIDNAMEIFTDDILNGFFLRIIKDFTLGIYISSFCGISKNDYEIKKDGLLSQWRGYGKKEGIAIEFHTNKLWNISNIENNKFHYRHFLCVPTIYYGEEERTNDLYVNMFKSLVDKLMNGVRFSSNLEKQFTSEEKEKYSKAMLSFSELFRLKHKGFSEEREFRFVFSPTNVNKIIPEEFRNQELPEKQIHFNSKPYIKLFEDIEDNAFLNSIERILVGPSAQQDQVAEYVRLLTRHLDIQVDKSTIPYREQHN